MIAGQRFNCRFVNNCQCKTKRFRLEVASKRTDCERTAIVISWTLFPPFVLDFVDIAKRTHRTVQKSRHVSSLYDFVTISNVRLIQKMCNNLVFVCKYKYIPSFSVQYSV